MSKKGKKNTDIRGYKYFKTTATIGYDVKGKPIRKIFYGKSKGDAENKKKEYLGMIDSGLSPDLASQSLGKAMYDWFWNIEKNAGNKSSTFERYDSIFRNHIKDSSIAKIQLSNINKMTLSKFYTEKLNHGSSVSTIKNVNKLLNKFFIFALSEGYIPRNPLSGLKLPSEREDLKDDEEYVTNIETISTEDLNKILDTLKNDKLRYIILFAVLTGARMGEILALKRSDIKDGVVKINKTVRTAKIFKDENTYTNERRVTRPKNNSSIRDIPLPEVLQKELRNLTVLVNEEKLKLGPAYTNNNLLFPSLTGTYIDDKNLRTSWKRALKNAGVDYIKFHSLRHTYATRMIENGVSILTVSRLLGHSSIKTTEIYAHTLEDAKIQAVNTLNSIINN